MEVRGALSSPLNFMEHSITIRMLYGVCHVLGQDHALHKELTLALYGVWKALVQFTKLNLVCKELFQLLPDLTSSVRWAQTPPPSASIGGPLWGSPKRMGGKGVPAGWVHQILRVMKTASLF